jgi:dephospho-CoA kinase
MILGITGTNGAGKGAVVDYLVEKKGFAHYSLRALILEEIERRGLEPNRTNMGIVGTDLRRTHGPAYFTHTCIERARSGGHNNIIIESIRSVSEADEIHDNNGFIVAVDAPRQLRYERITSRASATDGISFEQFCVEEDRELISKDPDDPAEMNMQEVMRMADYTLVNDGTFDELATKIEAMLAELE